MKVRLSVSTGQLKDLVAASIEAGRAHGMGDEYISFFDLEVEEFTRKDGTVLHLVEPLAVWKAIKALKADAELWTTVLAEVRQGVKALNESE